MRLDYRWWIGLAVLLLAALAVVAGWLWMRRETPTPGRPAPDMVKVLQANNRGVGFMEQFDYPSAVAAFQEAVDLAPDWLPGRINLGIAFLNADAPPDHLDRATDLFQQVLKEDSENPYAHYCLGLIFSYQNKPQDALPHFEAVTRIDPRDSGAWYRLATTLQQVGENQPDDADRAREAFEKAVQLDPYNSGAIYGLAMLLRSVDLKKADQLLAEHKALREAQWENPSNIKYGEMGHYAEVIGHIPELALRGPSAPLPLFARNDKLEIKLGPGKRWATSADFDARTSGRIQAAVRARFGAVMVMLDYDGDGKPDLFLLGAVLEKGEVQDLLLHNDGKGRFTDVTAEAGLGGARAVLGCCVADFDNDGQPDLFLTGIGKQWLFRNAGNGRFTDVTAEAGLDKLDTVCLGAAFVDLDQDSDLDLVITQYATTGDALAVLQGKPPAHPLPLAVYLNVGEAPPAAPHDKAPPLKPKFRRAEGPVSLLGEGSSAVGLATADVDLDRDLDLFVLADHSPASLILNDRLLRFHRMSLPESLVPPATWNGALVLDADRDGRSDLFLLGPGQRPLLLLNRSPGRQTDKELFQPGAVNSPALLQAQAVDLDLDGMMDVVGLSDQHRPVFLHNEGGKLVEASEALGSDAGWPSDLVAVAVTNFTGSCQPDLMLWSEKTGLQLYVNQGNGNHALFLNLTGRRGKDERSHNLRSNADGIGVRVMAQAEDLWTDAEFTTLSAGLGQSHLPLLLGLGPHDQADVVRLRWPDNTWQAEFNLTTCKVIGLEETNRRRTDSCPVLFTWNGQRFEFIADFLGAGSMGEQEPGGGYRLPRPEESVKIEGDQLVPLDGQFVIKVSEPMDEVTYLDRLQLLVVDHPADATVYPDERFVSSGPAPTQDLLAFREKIFPVQARDHQGRDVTFTLRTWDRDMVREFGKRSWLGFAEDHWITMDFGDRLSHLQQGQRLFLCLAGWTEYPYPESIWAADQAGVSPQPPVLQRQGPDGRWQTVAEVGFPAGLPRIMTVEVTGKVDGPSCILRLRTNMTVYWDQAFIAPLGEAVRASEASEGKQMLANLHVTPLQVSMATLAARGCPQELSPDGTQPTIYDYDRLDPVPVTRQAGYLTRLGEVTELLNQVDDRFVIFGPGDEVTVHFDGHTLPDLPPGWKRSFVLRTWGWCKDGGPFTALGESIEPLPFRGMSNYPYPPQQHYPDDAAHARYRREFNIRRVGPGIGTAPRGSNSSTQGR